MADRKWKVGEQGLALKEYGEGLPKVLYEVKVLETKRHGKRTRYLVHFQGWKSSYDEWVEEVLPVTPENLEKKRELEEKAKEEHRKLKAKRAAERKELEKAIMSKRPKKECTETPTNELKLNFPATLKKQLYEDYENVTIRKHLVKLPRRVTVEMVLEEYVEKSCAPFGLSSSSGKVESDTVREVVDGLQILFDRVLGSHLLYSFEKLQYEAMREKHPEDETDHLIIKDVQNKKRRRLSQLYGCEHLLRLLIKLPDIVSAKELIEHEAEELVLVLNDFLKYVGKSKERFLGANVYVQASQDYLSVIQDM